MQPYAGFGWATMFSVVLFNPCQLTVHVTTNGGACGTSVLSSKCLHNCCCSWILQSPPGVLSVTGALSPDVCTCIFRNESSSGYSEISECRGTVQDAGISKSVFRVVEGDVHQLDHSMCLLSSAAI